MKRLILALLALILCGCTARADGDVSAQAETWTIHGITITEGGAVAVTSITRG